MTSPHEKLYFEAQKLKQDSLELLRKSKADTNTADFFEWCVNRYQDQPCVAAVDHEISYTYRELDNRANQVSHWGCSIANETLKKQEQVALMMENRPEFLALTLGLAKIGVTIALINTNLSRELLFHAIEISAASNLIISRKQRAKWDTLAEFQASKNNMTVFWYDSNSGTTDRQGVQQIALELDGFSTERPAKHLRLSITSRDPYIYIYTSGTTGRSKAAKFSHRRFIGAAVTWAGPTDFKLGDAYYVTLPLYHGNAGVVAVAPCLFAGCRIVLREKFSASNWWDDIRRFQCVGAVYIGELWRYLYTQPSQANEYSKTFSPLKTIVGNGLRLDLWECVKRFGISKVIEHYGSTEMPGDAILNYFMKEGSCGFLPPRVAKEKSMTGEGGVLIKYDVVEDRVIRSLNGFCEILEPGETGEMIMRLPDGVYDGYVGAEATQRKLYKDVFSVGDCWWSGGDLLKCDVEGFFYFVDRAGDTFRWKGENVATGEVSRAINTFPGIIESNVYGVSVPLCDGRAGMASIQVNANLQPPNFAFRDWSTHLACLLPSYARPIFVRFRTSEHDKTSTIKLQKFKYVQQGFNPAKCEGDEVWMWEGYREGTDEWVLVDDGVLSKLDTGKYRL